MILINGRVIIRSVKSKKRFAPDKGQTAFIIFCRISVLPQQLPYCGIIRTSTQASFASFNHNA
ncbi:hypothetical protein P4H83_32315, partial [Paenibacillus favisporus]|uniref:hypothetical protein n=1 Tax=Paenibacillus favisporus TaxID=221028 RepID=UPI002DB77297